jgi:hypothetical protein
VVNDLFTGSLEQHAQWKLQFYACSYCCTQRKFIYFGKTLSPEGIIASLELEKVGMKTRFGI